MAKRLAQVLGENEMHMCSLQVEIQKRCLGSIQKSVAASRSDGAIDKLILKEFDQPCLDKSPIVKPELMKQISQ